MTAEACVCCGGVDPVPELRTGSGAIHASCWDEHHSSPTMPVHDCGVDNDPQPEPEEAL